MYIDFIKPLEQNSSVRISLSKSNKNLLDCLEPSIVNNVWPNFIITERLLQILHWISVKLYLVYQNLQNTLSYVYLFHKTRETKFIDQYLVVKIVLIWTCSFARFSLKKKHFIAGSITVVQKNTKNQVIFKHFIDAKNNQDLSHMFHC